jgi:hypothetical protein
MILNLVLRFKHFIKIVSMSRFKSKFGIFLYKIKMSKLNLQVVFILKPLASLDANFIEEISPSKLKDSSNSTLRQIISQELIRKLATIIQ